MSTKVNFNIFNNSYKSKDIHPDYNGVFEIDGKQYKIAIWKSDKKDKNGNTIPFSAQISDVVKHEDKSNNALNDDSPF